MKEGKSKTICRMVVWST